jgi:hypothetical protein
MTDNVWNLLLTRPVSALQGNSKQQDRLPLARVGDVRASATACHGFLPSDGSNSETIRFGKSCGTGRLALVHQIAINGVGAIWPTVADSGITRHLATTRYRCQAGRSLVGIKAHSSWFPRKAVYRSPSSLNAGLGFPAVVGHCKRRLAVRSLSGRTSLKPNV